MMVVSTVSSLEKGYSFMVHTKALCSYHASLSNLTVEKHVDV